MKRLGNLSQFLSALRPGVLCPLEPLGKLVQYWLKSEDAMRDSVQKIALGLSAKIESGEWADGFRLPPERRLAAEHGLARNTLRQALAALEQRGLIVRHVGRGTFVK